MSRPRADRLALVEQFDEVVAFVEANPGANTNAVARAVRARRNVALALLRLARAAGVLRAEPRARRSSAWFVARRRSDWYPCREAGSFLTFEVPVDERLPLALWTVLVKLRAGWRCEACGAEPVGRDRSLHAHHVDRDALNHRLANGRALCSRCHADLHNALRFGVDCRLDARTAER